VAQAAKDLLGNVVGSELLALADLLEMLLTSPRTGVLTGLLVIAATIDVRSGRIPNWLVFAGAVYAISYNSLFPQYPRDNGTLFALGGLAVGLAAFLPAYFLRILGAGDVKLMAMVGAFLGTRATVGAVLGVLIAGGVLAAGFAVKTGRLTIMLRNITAMFRGTWLALATGVGGSPMPASPSAARMPYGLAIALGTIGYLVLEQLGMI
jgi:prepilin peptidase CpaA